MPKRSNDFQKLVFIVKQHASEHATVTESKFLIDNITKSKREVDICIEDSIAGHQITISIECRDHKRKACVKWVEEMKCKHERLPTHALVLVSKAGFSNEAKKIAHNYGIETLALDEISSGSMNRYFDKLDSIFGKTLIISPSKVVARVEKIDSLSAENVVTIPCNVIYNFDGIELSTAKELVETKLNTTSLIREMLMHGNKTHNHFEVLWKKPTDDEGNSLYLRKEEPLVLRRIEAIQILGQCEFLISKFALERGILGKTQIVWGKGKLMKKDSMLVATEDETGKNSLSITIQDGTAKQEPLLIGEMRHKT